ncbi:MAG: ATP-binding protein [Caulobacteraceae bacterium]
MQSSPLSVVQDNDGFLWFGANSGLYRFDGVTFDQWRDRSGVTPDLDEVKKLFVARNGDIYIGSLEGLSRISHGYWKHIVAPMEYPGPFAQDSNGRIWVAHAGHRYAGSSLCSVEDGRINCLASRNGLLCPDNQAITLDHRGGIWVGGASGICRWDVTGRARNVSPVALDHQHTVMALGLAATPNGQLWGGLSVAGAGRGLMRLQNGRWSTLSGPGADGARLAVESMWTDRRGSVWIGTFANGLYRYADRRLDHFGVADGLSDNEVLDGFEDREGSIWVVTPHGVDQFRDMALTAYTSREGLPAAGAAPIAASRDGTIWIGGQASVYVMRKGVIQKLNSGGAALRGPAYTLLADSQGAVWIGGLDGAIRWDGGHARRLQDPAGHSLPWVVAAVEDVHHDVWLATLERLDARDITRRPPKGGLIRFHQGRPVETIPSPAETGQHAISRLAADPRGGLWVGVAQHGLFRLAPKGGFQRVDGIPADATIIGLQSAGPGEAWVATLNGVFWVGGGRVRSLGGLPNSSARSVTLDRAGNLWVGLKCGLVRIARADLARWLLGQTAEPAKTIFGIESGYTAALGPPPVVAPDGRIWFPGANDVRVLDPKHLPFNPMPPGVQVLRVVADRLVHPGFGPVTAPKLVHQIEIDYTGLSYVRPGMLKFHVRLVGHDRGWIDVGARRQAFYNELPPGKYQFEVIACNDDDVCNSRIAKLPLTIPPAWWQTLWFKAAATVGACSLLGAILRRRMVSYGEDVRSRFNERLQERTRVARELHDTLMQSLLAGKLLADNAKRVHDDPADLRSALERISHQLARAAEEGRATVEVLRHSTMENSNLAEAIEKVIVACQGSSAVETHLRVTGRVRKTQPMICDEVYRIASEAIRNACVHADASQLWVTVDYGTALTVTVRDDGCGIDPKVLKTGRSGHFGLVGMRERAMQIGARLRIASNSSGTEVSLRVPASAIYRPPVGRLSWPRRRPQHRSEQFAP